MTKPIKLRRTFHYIPGSYPQLLEGSDKVPADVICFDLEDSVPGPGKTEARKQLVQVIPTKKFGPREVIVRVNGFDTQWGEDDVKAVAALPINGILLPKAESAATVRKAVQLAEGAGASAGLRIWCQIETPFGVLRAEEIAAADPRLEGFVIGGADLVETMGARNTPMRLPLLGPLTHTIIVARAYGLAVIDAVHPNFQNDDGFLESCQQAAELGFDGKSVAFPRQLPVANKAFGPTQAAIDYAQKAIASAAKDGGGSSGYENLHLAHARRTMELVDFMAQRDALFAQT